MVYMPKKCRKQGLSEDHVSSESPCQCMGYSVDGVGDLLFAR